VYEVTGLSDVLRGASDPEETATAQSIKAQYGGLRIQKAQREVQRFVRDLLRLKADIIATHFSDETLLKIDGPNAGDPDAMQVHMAAVQMVRSDEVRYYRVDIETDSTIAADLTQAQNNAARFLQAAAQYGATFIPMVQQFQLPPEPLLKLFQAVASQYKLGKQAELAIDEMIEQIAAQQANNPPEEQAAKRQEQEDMQRQGQMLALQEQAAEAAKKAAEAQGQQLENVQHAQMGPTVAEDWVG